jgi:hypothetical protein
MQTQNNPSTHITDIRHLATHFDARTIEQCMQQALANQPNPCYSGVENTEVMNVLAKSRFIIGQMQQGLTLAQALRELGRRMRLLTKGQ